MKESEGETRPPEAEVGLCSHCTHAAQQTNVRGNTFWRCRAADEDAALLRYPPLPVSSCHAYRAD